jgi:predicted house-cleaning noncanonical NTP pyrophosphatase (MazG superfamily)
MKKVNRNKLVRDRIPNIIIGHDLSFKARKLGAVEFENELTNKLIEEANEVAEKVQWLNHKCEQEPVSKEEHTLDMQEIKEELADVLEVYVHLVKALGLTTNDIEAAANEKRAKRGSFEDKIYLEWVEDANEANKKGKLK